MWKCKSEVHGQFLAIEPLIVSQPKFQSLTDFLSDLLTSCSHTSPTSHPQWCYEVGGPAGDTSRLNESLSKLAVPLSPVSGRRAVQVHRSLCAQARRRLPSFPPPSQLCGLEGCRSWVVESVAFRFRFRFRFSSVIKLMSCRRCEKLDKHRPAQSEGRWVAAFSKAESTRSRIAANFVVWFHH